MPSSNAAVFEDIWRRFHPESPPVGWMMRRAQSPNWVRFHSLPDSKRYAETPGEHAIVLNRANTLASEVLGNATRCWLVLYDWDIPAEAVDSRTLTSRAWIQRISAERAFAFVEQEDEDDSVSWRIFASRTDWRAGAFDDLIKDVANDAVNALWVSEANGAVFAPYDGGVDLFLSRPQDVDWLRTAHAGWLSAHPEGL